MQTVLSPVLAPEIELAPAPIVNTELFATLAVRVSVPVLTVKAVVKVALVTVEALPIKAPLNSTAVISNNPTFQSAVKGTVPSANKSPLPAGVCHEQVPSPSSRRYLVAPPSPVDKTAVPSILDTPPPLTTPPD